MGGTFRIHFFRWVCWPRSVLHMHISQNETGRTVTCKTPCIQTTSEATDVRILQNNQERKMKLLAMADRVHATKVVLEKQCALELANSKKQNKYKHHVKAPGIRRSKNPIPTCHANKCTSCLQNICFDTKGPISLLEPQMPLSSGHPQTHPNSLHWMPLSNHAPPTLAVQPSALQSMERTGPSRGSSARSGWMRLIEMCFSFFGATIDQAKGVQCKPVMF